MTEAIDVYQVESGRNEKECADDRLPLAKTLIR